MFREDLPSLPHAKPQVATCAMHTSPRTTKAASVRTRLQRSAAHDEAREPWTARVSAAAHIHAAEEGEQLGEPTHHVRPLCTRSARKAVGRAPESRAVAFQAVA